VVETCGFSADLTEATTLIVYDDQDCPPDPERVVAVSANVGGSCGPGSRVTLGAPFSNYKLRLGDGTGDTAAGRIAVYPIDRPDCPPLSFVSQEPWWVEPVEYVDVNRPHPSDDPTALEGFDRIRVAVVDPLVGETESVFDASCWSVCETAHNNERHPPYPPELVMNEVVEVETIEPLEEFELVLKRPITPGETTILRYTDLNGRTQDVAWRFALPGDVNRDGHVGPEDLLKMIDDLDLPPCGDFVIGWCGPFPGDINRSGTSTAADVLELIDLMTGAGTFEPWMGASLPREYVACP
jgi:hypothetical protein